MPSNPQVPDGWRMARLGEGQGPFALKVGVSSEASDKRDRIAWKRSCPGRVQRLEIGRHSNKPSLKATGST